MALPTGAGATFTWPVPVYGYAAYLNGVRKTGADAADFWDHPVTGGGTLSFSIGAGSRGTATNITGNTAGLALAPDGGAVVLGRHSGTGNYTIEVRTYDVSTTATATVSGSSLTCAAACTNMFYVGGKVDIPGAGNAGGLYTGTVIAVSANGRTVTLSDAVGTTFSSQTKTLRFYLVQIPTFDTGFPATCSVILTLCDTSFLVQLQGNQFSLRQAACFRCSPIWKGTVVRFGGPFRPKFTWSRTVAAWQMTADAFGGPAHTDFRPIYGTPYAGVWTYPLIWGVEPSITGVFGGGGNNHPSTAEFLMLSRLFRDAGWVIPTGGQRSATYTPTTGFSYTIPPGQTMTLLTPAGTLATGTVTLPAVVAENQAVQIVSTQAITTLTINPPAGLTLVGASVTTIAANGTLTYRRAGSNLVRVQ